MKRVKLVPNSTHAKSLGAYYTDEAVAAFLVNWAVRSKSDRVIDPSFGGGVFLEKCLERIEQLGGQAGEQVFGIELDPEVHQVVGQELAENYVLNRSHLFLSDFFNFAPSRVPALDAVVGNPPYIRYQSFTGAARNKGLARAAEQGVSLNRLSSSWAPFLVHSTAFLKEGGNLAMVVPMELGHAAYARPILEFLTRSFGRVTLLTFKRPLFPELSQDTLLLLADNRGAQFQGLSWRDLSGVAELVELAAPNVPASKNLDHRALVDGRDKLVTNFIDERAYGLYCELRNATSIFRLGDRAQIGIGYVSGNNRFFHPTAEAVRSWGLPKSVLAPSVFKGRAFRSIRFTQDDWKEQANSAAAGHLLYVRKGKRVHERLRAYIRHGEASGVHQGYKCRIRTPWYVVPHVHMPDAFLTYMSGARPQLVANDAAAYAPNSLHVVRINPQAQVSPSELATLWLSSLTGLSTEIEGHAMGGGMLKLEPAEAKRVLLANPTNRLEDLALEVDGLLREGKRAAACELVDVVVLENALGLSRGECALLGAAATDLRNRRYYRGRVD